MAARFFVRLVYKFNQKFGKIEAVIGIALSVLIPQGQSEGFRLFDKVKYEGQVGFIFGRRSLGYFDVRRLDGTRISASANYKKLRLLQKRKSYLTELRTGSGASSPELPRGYPRRF